jgi:hypothetical protein
MADELKVPQFSKQKKLKTKSVTINAPLPTTGTYEYTPPVTTTVQVYVTLTEEQIESCRKGQDIFDFARDIEELVRINNKI